MTGTELILCTLILYCVLAPARYDPAIRLKYWTEGKKFPGKEEWDGWLW